MRTSGLVSFVDSSASLGVGYPTRSGRCGLAQPTPRTSHRHVHRTRQVHLGGGPYDRFILQREPYKPSFRHLDCQSGVDCQNAHDCQLALNCQRGRRPGDSRLGGRRCGDPGRSPGHADRLPANGLSLQSRAAYGRLSNYPQVIAITSLVVPMFVPNKRDLTSSRTSAGAECSSGPGVHGRCAGAQLRESRSRRPRGATSRPLRPFPEDGCFGQTPRLASHAISRLKGRVFEPLHPQPGLRVRPLFRRLSTSSPTGNPVAGTRRMV